MKRFALAGNPNCGKTTLFNSLTGSTAHVGNWPGVTVESRDGIYKGKNEQVAIVDLPGIYSLSPYTPEEIVARNYIIDEKPDCIINIIDATNLERNLYLTTQIMEIDVPLVIALNMTDALEKNGDKINVEQLEKKIGVPVVSISALLKKGLDELMDRAIETSETKRKGITVLENTPLMHLISDCRIALDGQNVENSLFHAIKLAEYDDVEVKDHPTSAKMVEEFKTTYHDEIFGQDLDAVIADSRYKYITSNYSPTLTRGSRKQDSEMSKSDKADKILTHKIWGIPIFLFILFLIFHFTFSENLFFIGAALGDNFVTLEGTSFEGVFGEGGIASPGVFLQNLLCLGTDSLTNVIKDAMVNSEIGEWAIGLICDGIFGGIFAVLSFIPQILLLFLFFSILEDSGYMARIAFILDRLLKKFGLSGRAFMPMIMGWGCSVPAMINTRTLSDEKERIATIRVIPFFSCGAKLPVLTAIAGGIATSFGMNNADLITYGMYVLGVAVAICAVLLMRSTTMRGETPPFIMELPTYHLPQFHNLMIHLWDKLKHFLKKAFTVILASTIVIWFISHFTFDWKYLDDSMMNDSILAGIGKLIQPIFTPVGFGVQLGEYGWVFVVAAFAGLIAKENIVATLGTLATCIVSGFEANEAEEGIDSVAALINAITSNINISEGQMVAILIAFIAFNMLTIPCFAAVATAKAELPSKKTFGYTLLFWIGTSYSVSTMIYLIGSWWWTCFIFIGIWALVITIIALNYKGKIDLSKLNILKRARK